MIGTPAIRNLIRENKIAQMYSAIQTGAQIGMQTLDQNLQELVRRNVISMAEARGKAANKDNFAGSIEGPWNANRQPNSSTTCCARCSRRRARTFSSPPASRRR